MNRLPQWFVYAIVALVAATAFHFVQTMAMTFYELSSAPGTLSTTDLLPLIAHCIHGIAACVLCYTSTRRHYRAARWSLVVFNVSFLNVFVDCVTSRSRLRGQVLRIIALYVSAIASNVVAAYVWRLRVQARPVVHLDSMDAVNLFLTPHDMSYSINDMDSTSMQSIELSKKK